MSVHGLFFLVHFLVQVQLTQHCTAHNEKIRHYVSAFLSNHFHSILTHSALSPVIWETDSFLKDTVESMTICECSGIQSND
jgi:hypothetical protein